MEKLIHNVEGFLGGNWTMWTYSQNCMTEGPSEVVFSVRTC